MGKAADDPNEKLKLKMFLAEIINDSNKIFKPIPNVSTVTQQQAMDNHFQVKYDIKQMIKQK